MDNFELGSYWIIRDGPGQNARDRRAIHDLRREWLYKKETEKRKAQNRINIGNSWSLNNG